MADAIAYAIDEQSTATQEIAHNISAASHGMRMPVARWIACVMLPMACTVCSVATRTEPICAAISSVARAVDRDPGDRPQHLGRLARYAPGHRRDRIRHRRLQRHGAIIARG
jgi:hypothetical protein